MIVDAAGPGFAPTPDVQARSAARPWSADIGVALALTVLAAAARIGIEQVVGGVAPFVLTFPAVMAATLIGGGRPGTLTAVGCQILTIRYVFPHWISPHGGVSADLANVLLSTIALGSTVWATASYRTASALLRSRCEHQVHRLSLLIAEIDHRTKNNFQIAANLLAHQSIVSFDPTLARELNKAATRLETIASVYQGLSIDGECRQHLNLAKHLERIVTLLRTGATPDHVVLAYRADPFEVTVQSAIIIGLIVNEWVTNALKHAFAGAPGRILVDVAQKAGRIEILVQDDGDQPNMPRPMGRGSDLVKSLAEVIDAQLSIERDGGTRCSLSCRPS